MVTLIRCRALLVAAVLAVAPAVAFAAGPQGQITYLDGTVTIDSSPATIGDEVPLGASVQTDPASECEIVFRGRNILRLGESTTLVYNPANLQVGSHLQRGSLTLVLKNLFRGASADHNFFIRTPTTAAGVRGTFFFIKIEDPTTTYVCLCNGVIDLDDGTPAGRHLEARHHDAYRFHQDGGALTVTHAPMLYHTDAALESLAAKVGVTIDWTRVDH